MKHLLDTLFVTTQGAYLSKDHEHLVVKVDRKAVMQVPLLALAGVVCFGRVNVSSYAMHACAEAGVTISWLGYTGRFLARMQGPVSGNVLLRKAQYFCSEDTAGAAAIACATLAAKVINGRADLLRAARDAEVGDDQTLLRDAAEKLGTIAARLSAGTELETARGLEGDAARIYFGLLTCRMKAQREGFAYERRSRRPPEDRINALLGFLYSLLCHDCIAACEAIGLDPAVGFLHRDRPGRPGLALDLMEEFRAPLADRLALALINRRQINPDGFETTESGAVQMTAETRKTVIDAWRAKKEEEVLHPFLEERMKMGMVPHVQALLLARHLRGDLDAYPPFLSG